MGCRLRGWPAGVCLVALLGCNAYDPDLLQELSGTAMGPVTRRGDAAVPCAGASEACNAEDDDCDGKVDEGAERACLFRHATSVCVTSGDCVIVECEGGYADCNRELTDGCEQRSDEIECGMCGKVCPGEDDGATGGPSSQPDDDGRSDEEDAGSVAPPPCVASAERCDDLDNDCDAKTDEGTVCAVAMCVATTPSYRGAACDQCVCERCAPLVALCQNHPDSTWATQCRDLVECVVVQSRMGQCPNGDCYGAGTGPCADETVTAAGGAAQVVTGCAGGTSPPPAACAAAVNYRDQCTTTTCSSVCTQ